MATNPGLFTECPWKRLGAFKYLVVVPWVAHGVHRLATVGWWETDLGYLTILPSMLLRAAHDQIILFAVLLYLGSLYLPGGQHLPLWGANDALLLAVLHAGPVEWLYYWFHRALPHHFLYTRYHSHHHASIVTESIHSEVQGGRAQGGGRRGRRLALPRRRQPRIGLLQTSAADCFFPAGSSSAEGYFFPVRSSDPPPRNLLCPDCTKNGGELQFDGKKKTRDYTNAAVVQIGDIVAISTIEPCKSPIV